MKKIFCCILIVFVFISSPIFSNRAYDFSYGIVYAETTEKQEIENELSENIKNQLASLDTSQLDKILQEISNNAIIGDSQTFAQKISEIINGDLSLDINSFGNYLFDIFIKDIVDFLPYMCLIIAIAVLYSMVNASQNGKSRGINDVIHFVCFGAIVVIIFVWVVKLMNLTTSTIGSIKTQMELIFPLLLTIMTALGGSVSINVFQPAMAILSSTVVSVFVNILIPIFIFSLVFIVISNLTTTFKFNKFADFFSSSFKWIMGIVLMLFTSFVSIQGIMAGSIDSISIKTAKYTIKSAVPIIGGFLSDGINLIMASSVLIKNAIGVGGLLILLITMLLPVIKIIVFSFLMKLGGAILEPIADSRVSNFVASMAKAIQSLVAVILGIAFMYFILIALVMCSANVL